MIKIISKKEYKTLMEIINKQDDQITELIVMTADALEKANRATKCYCNLVELVDNNIQSLPPKAIETLHEIKNLMWSEG